MAVPAFAASIPIGDSPARTQHIRLAAILIRSYKSATPPFKQRDLKSQRMPCRLQQYRASSGHDGLAAIYEPTWYTMPRTRRAPPRDVDKHEVGFWTTRSGGSQAYRLAACHF
jgi:hypothetical protein